MKEWWSFFFLAEDEAGAVERRRNPLGEAVEKENSWKDCSLGRTRRSCSSGWQRSCGGGDLTRGADLEAKS